ncbi:monosaccharide ABC transporter ATP-binding protein (CUT2 family) [Actinocorallia herbida]|uniref:Monosaccharide ABC transporter ATP-binding protein (CUT2 family) n=1 Tax=Actinocorallia herbida TaxID=58109 RepID=A0A3N1CZH7_9ACTN|nr:sugar ABC transporter ATP-binding protein [Actinocorallia herbida]ROO86685.1 monosaccharide ABC transporter ATP-binding protein (CUT2 family) [Actinocorallia herbida]
MKALELHSVSKVFGSQRALAGVDLELHAGEVHALLGQNGSGKSTLIKVLAGFHAPDGPAEASVLGAPLALGDAAAAYAAGLRFVHQDLALIDKLDVTDNLALGERYAGRRWLGHRRERAAAAAHLAAFGIDLDPDRLVGELSSSQRTMVAVVRALHPAAPPARVLVLDEVTASLPKTEVEQVFALIRRIRDDGGTVLYVTHRLEEVFAIADRVTVLRDARRVATSPVGRLDHDGLVELIVGRRLDEFYPAAPHSRDEVVLSARGLTGRTVTEVDLDVHRGEVLGIAGLAGSGREEIPYLLFGARPWTGGELRLGGTTYDALTPPAAIAHGLALIPADRAGEGATPSMSLRENLTLPRLRSNRAGWMSLSRERRESSAWLDRLRVVPADGEAPLSRLSGGNQQKVMLARWFRCDPAVLLLDEPTQGIDVGSKAAIYEQLTERTGQGLSVVVASTDHEELAAICDRVLVVAGGRIRAELSGRALTADAISKGILARPGDPVNQRGADRA